MALLQQLANPMGEGRDKMKVLQTKRRLHRWLSLRSVPVSAKLLDAWFRESGSAVIGDEESTIYPVGPGQWIVRGEGIGRIYRPDVGFVPSDMAALLEG